MNPKTTRLAVRAAGAMGVAFVLLACGDGGCQNTVLNDVHSPDNLHRAVVFVRSCGATTDFSTNVSIVSGARTVEGAGNVFTADTDHGQAIASPNGGPKVAARWIDARMVEVRYDAHARVFQETARKEGISVQFAKGLQLPYPAPTSRPRASASFRAIPR